ncbi:hypothetical protein [Clostridium hydrogenum]|uniref:hypothetical protein n=1 Tax=Clostridium hydrogenum TaxID=2855764 RepID=UPI001F2C9620|nr:hypothetical protein [Clostridium hydrogenum]
MLNEKALKMVGPTYEEVGAKTKGTVSPDSTPLISVSLTIAYSPVFSTITILTHSKRK